MDNQALIEQIKAVTSAEDMTAVRALIEATGGKMAAEVQQALLDKLAEFTASSKAAREGAIATLKLHGVDYPLTDWLTPTNYAKQFNIEPNGRQTVNNWIARGIIPADHVKEIPELDLRLVRAIEYSPRPYTVAGASAESKDA